MAAGVVSVEDDDDVYFRSVSDFGNLVMAAVVSSVAVGVISVLVG